MFTSVNFISTNTKKLLENRQAFKKYALTKISWPQKLRLSLHHQQVDLALWFPPAQSGSALPSPGALFQKCCAFHPATEWV